MLKLIILLFVLSFKTQYVVAEASHYARVSNSTDYLNSRHILNSQNSLYQINSGIVVAEDLVSKQSDEIRFRTERFGNRFNLCEGESFSESLIINAAYCSSTLVGPDLVVTAAHCLKVRSCDQMAFVFGLTQSDLRGSEYNYSNPISLENHYFECKAVLQTGTNWSTSGLGGTTENDWAIIRLNRPVPGAINIPYRRSGQIEIGESVRTVGNPRGLASVESYGTVKQRSRGHEGQSFLTTTMYAQEGNSGGGMFSGLDLFEGILVETFDPNILRPFEDNGLGCNTWKSQEAYRDLSHPRIGSHIVPVSNFRSVMQRYLRSPSGSGRQSIDKGRRDNGLGGVQ